MEHITLKISLIQMDVACGDPKANLSRAETMINKALKQRKKPNVVVLPEMWTTGLDWEASCEAVEQDKGLYIERLRNIAATDSVNIVAGSIVNMGPSQRFFNSAYIIDSQGHIVTRYDQVHLERRSKQDISTGSTAVTFDIDGIPCGIILGYDLRFPEFVRQLALMGAKVNFCSGNVVESSGNPLETFKHSEGYRKPIFRSSRKSGGNRLRWSIPRYVDGGKPLG